MEWPEPEATQSGSEPEAPAPDEPGGPHDSDRPAASADEEAATDDTVVIGAVGGPNVDPPGHDSAEPGEPPNDYAGLFAPLVIDDGKQTRPGAAAGVTEAAPVAASPLEAPAPQPHTPGLHPACRDCGRMNDNRLRFCSKCGNALVLTPSGGSRIASKRTTWWERRFGGQQRAERRAYRRSLPAFYRWRPVVVGGMALLLIGVGGAALVKRQQADPDNPVVDAWYSFHRYAVPLQRVRATVVGSALARGTTAAALTDTTFVATTMVWKTPTEVPCAADPVIELHWKTPERIRWIAFRPGLPMFDSTRDTEFRPKTVEISTGDPRRCIRMNLTDGKERQQFALDTKDPRLIDPPTRGKVTTIRIAVIDAYPPKPAASAAAGASASPSSSASASPSASPDQTAAADTKSIISFTEIRLFRMREANDGPPPSTA